MAGLCHRFERIVPAIDRAFSSKAIVMCWKHQKTKMSTIISVGTLCVADLAHHKFYVRPKKRIYTKVDEFIMVQQKGNTCNCHNSSDRNSLQHTKVVLQEILIHLTMLFLLRKVASK
jgi:hypothetical protein